MTKQTGWQSFGVRFEGDVYFLAGRIGSIFILSFSVFRLALVADCGGTTFCVDDDVGFTWFILEVSVESAPISDSLSFKSSVCSKRG